jgi:hypothetical protein
MPGARRTQASCAKVESTRVRNHGQAAINQHSLHDGLRLISCSPVTGLFCHRRRGSLHDPNTSVGASGSHDFAVRLGFVGQRAAKVSTASRTQRP